MTAQSSDPIKSSLVNNEFNWVLVTGTLVRGYLVDIGQLPGSYTTKEKSSSNQLLVYILGEELGILSLLCCLLSQEALECFPKPVFPFVRESLGAHLVTALL